MLNVVFLEEFVLAIIKLNLNSKCFIFSRFIKLFFIRIFDKQAENHQ